jgi:hypothetical protein
VIELLDEPARRDRLAAEAREFVAPMTWEAAAGQVERILRGWLAERWQRSGAGQSRSASVDLARP